MLHGGEVPCPCGNIDISIRWPVDCESPASPLLPFVWEIEHGHKLPSDRLEVNAARVSGLVRTLLSLEKNPSAEFCFKEDRSYTYVLVPSSNFLSQERLRVSLSPSLTVFVRGYLAQLSMQYIMQRNA